MKKKWILVMDSGLGGTWTLGKIKKSLPNENYIFFMDKFNAPYGNKNVNKLKRLVYENIKKITTIFDVKLVVLACNTLSSVCYDFLKQNFISLPIVKIEPFFLPQRFENKSTLVIATKNTIKYCKSLKRYQNYSNIYLKGFGTLAKKIDMSNGNYQELQTYLAKKLNEFKNKNIQNVVLGCTHFNFIKTQIRNIFGSDICFFENSENVAIKVKRLLTKSNLLEQSKALGQTLFLYKI